MCSEKTEKNRLRRATGLPVDSQKAGSSGRQSSIQRPGRVATATGAVRWLVVAVVIYTAINMLVTARRETPDPTGHA